MQTETAYLNTGISKKIRMWYDVKKGLLNAENPLEFKIPDTKFKP